MKRTNSNAYKKAIQSYLLDAIHDPDTEREMSAKEKVDFFFQRYESEYNSDYTKRRYPNHQERLAQYLTGLPSILSIAFESHKILELAAKLHECEIPEGKKDTILNNYWNHMAFHMMRLRESM